MLRYRHLDADVSPALSAAVLVWVIIEPELSPWLLTGIGYPVGVYVGISQGMKNIIIRVIRVTEKNEKSSYHEYFFTFKYCAPYELGEGHLNYVPLVFCARTWSCNPHFPTAMAKRCQIGFRSQTRARSGGCTRLPFCVPRSLVSTEKKGAAGSTSWDWLASRARPHRGSRIIPICARGAPLRIQGKRVLERDRYYPNQACSSRGMFLGCKVQCDSSGTTGASNKTLSLLWLSLSLFHFGRGVVSLCFP